MKKSTKKVELNEEMMKQVTGGMDTDITKLNKNSSDLSKSLKKVSSGMKINGA